MQIEIIAAVCLCLDRHGVKALNARQYNAIIEAANDILAEVESPHRSVVANSGMRAWLASDETGASSRYMAGVLGMAAQIESRPGFLNGDPKYPLDDSDFGRCVGLLDAVPGLREHLPVMADHGPGWAALVGAWDELEALHREESPSGTAPKLYARMQELLAKAKE